MKKSFDQSIKVLKNLHDKTTNKQVKGLKKNNSKGIEWLSFEDLVGILQEKLVPGLELGNNVFVYPALSFYTRSGTTIVNPSVVPLYNMNLKEQKDGFSCSFIVPSYEYESLASDDGHWIGVHVVKTGDTLNWFVICSMNYDILGTNSGLLGKFLKKNNNWWDKIEFMIHMLLHESAHHLSFANRIINEKVLAWETSLEEIPERIEKITTSGALKELLKELDGMRMLYLIPGCKKNMDLYRTAINTKLGDEINESQKKESQKKKLLKK